MRWQATGPVDAQVVLWLHGFLGDRRDWMPIAAAMPGYRHVFVDLPGHGESAPVPAPRSGFDVVVAGLLALLGGHGAAAGPVHVVGYSLGARVAMALAPALSAAGRMGRLALVSGHPGIRDVEARRARLELDRRRAERLRQIGLPAFVAEWYALPLLRSLKALPDAEAIMTRRSQGDAHARASTLLSLSTGDQPDRLAAVAALGEAVLWIAGADDAVYSPLLRAAHARTPRSELRLIVGAAHHVHLAQPAHCVAALRAHLSGLSGPAAG